MKRQVPIASVFAALLAGALLVGAGHAVAAQTQRPDATISWSTTSADVGVGATWGSGTLTYKGKRYPISMNGLNVGAVGVETASGSANVYHLNRLSDFNGTYAAVGAGATVGGGGDVAAMKNQKGVVVELKATARGLQANIGPSGVKMELKSARS
jgi:hypothetical protein